jgi:hypothetical protein
MIALMKKLFGLGAAFVLLGCGTDVTTTTGGGGESSTTTTTDNTGGNAATTSAGGSGPTSSSTTASGQGGGGIHGECATNADCPDNGECVDLEPGGNKVCKYPVQEATMCTEGDPDECCNSTECDLDTKCYPFPLSPHCGGAQPQPHNVCAKDQCASNNDCPDDGVCVPAGALGFKVATCIPAACHGTICGQESITDCVIAHHPCCGNAIGLACVGECATNADCPDGYCDISQDTFRLECFPGGPPCPP